ncbi:quinone-dependent dihydroorotate dehydrogenase [Anaerolineales bacterium HSG6]|nr:quinone-dependent dihydroorotate dehydrogenase [Anaerolineales bacterium HSG6]MDM8530408.1 quinone-dependent dihydroorotate dehydrogenase [Anaerolineales bacterium HSG25]
MSYSLIRPLLFKLSAERAHHVTLSLLRYVEPALPLLRLKQVQIPREVMGLQFPNMVGLAAGLDKNGDCIDAFGRMGFGFLEVGTVTPRPQPGNPQPRLFRLPEKQAIINRMGFNNKGVDYLVDRLKSTRYKGIIGVNIGKNFDTPLENALTDYLICMEKVYAYASFITVNISSPNTKGLRDLQEAEGLTRLLNRLKFAQGKLTRIHHKAVPLVVKIAPDLDEAQLIDMAKVFNQQQVEGVIATNTTIARDQVSHLRHGNETGGLSGAPLTQHSTEILTQLREHLDPNIPIIGVGGIMTPADAQAKISAGAELVQLYSGFVYSGPPLIGQVAQAVGSMKKG